MGRKRRNTSLPILYSGVMIMDQGENTVMMSFRFMFAVQKESKVNSLCQLSPYYSDSMTMTDIRFPVDSTKFIPS